MSTRPLSLVPPSQEETDSPVAMSAADSEMKNKLLGMISKSEEKRKKPRALPSLRGMPHLKSPTGNSKPEVSLPRPEMALPTSPVDKSATKRTLPMFSVGSAKRESFPPPPSPVEPRSSPVESLTAKHSLPASYVDSQKHSPLPTPPMESLKPSTSTSLPTSPIKKSLPTSHTDTVSSMPLEHLATEQSKRSLHKSQIESPLKPEHSLPLPPMETLNPLPTSPDKLVRTRPVSPLTMNTEPVGSFIKLDHSTPNEGMKQAPSFPISPKAASKSLAWVDSDPRLASLASDVMTIEEGSSSSDTEIRNTLPLSLEMESKRDSLPRERSSSDESIGASQQSLPTSLGHVSGPVSAQNHTSLEEVVATSLPDLNDQNQTEDPNQR